MKTKTAIIICGVFIISVTLFLVTKIGAVKNNTFGAFPEIRNTYSLNIDNPVNVFTETKQPPEENVTEVISSSYGDIELRYTLTKPVSSPQSTLTLDIKQGLYGYIRSIELLTFDGLDYAVSEDGIVDRLQTVFIDVFAFLATDVFIHKPQLENGITVVSRSYEAATIDSNMVITQLDLTFDGVCSEKNNTRILTGVSLNSDIQQLHFPHQVKVVCAGDREGDDVHPILHFEGISRDRNNYFFVVKFENSSIENYYFSFNAIKNRLEKIESKDMYSQMLIFKNKQKNH